MPVTWEIEPSHDLSVMTISWPHQAGEWRRVLDEILVRQPRPLRLMVDCRRIHTLTVTLADEFVLGCRARSEQLTGALIALIIVDESVFQMSRTLQVWTEVTRLPLTLTTFLEYDAAVAWLMSIEPL
jgi:hypothetical protein